MSITIVIIAITVVLSLICFSNRPLYAKLMLNPYMVNTFNQYYRIITHAFIHSDYMHLFVNMFVLFSFGHVAEAYFQAYMGPVGIFNFIFLYVGGILFSFLPSFIKHKNNVHYNAVGASGAVSAVLYSSIVFAPLSGIRIFFIPIDIPAIIFGVLYLIYEAYMDRKNSDHIAHDAHFWGAVFGFVYTLIVKKEIALSFVAQIQSVFL